ncbi:hypothetical protein BWGOE4_55080 [Bacillus mycoides]|uniref:YjdJ family protein n=1 Tax=Bacillus cereus group TaxID=86661 RepID=UPI000872C811|nr:YjdJ family protein [Bacillus mycoides]OFD35953.1 hypothetical protein BWGOE3_57500 [Bacillus mycoides]OFD52506.1 hypothetical protein BWGOE6_57540 [Bacillus mycoides]OFD53020.1 hypothetical protein BWGOE4_55080 [Bacillus mycoides]OFD58344.1 hypothetical protein BWGOE7_55140 [Bacillus mycoides]OFD89220.1 hypothetical protein BWGOE12_55190 [Bacillus mycoides]
MTINQMFQLGASFLLFISSTLISWYQGSNLIDDTLEWKYTAKFTNYFEGPVSNFKDIYQIDFFIYAAKFYPGSVIVMIISFIYMILLLVYIIYKRKNNEI